MKKKSNKFLTENVRIRIQNLKERGNMLSTFINNGIKVDKKDIEEYKQDVKYCKELLKDCKKGYYNYKLKNKLLQPSTKLV